MKTKRKIEHFDATSPLSLFYEFGLSPDEIKESIIDIFSVFFENKQNLKIYAVSNFVNNWLSYLTVYKDFPNSLEFINTILNIFNNAKKVNHNEAVGAYAYWFPEISQSISRFWSLNNNQVNLKELCIEDFLEESMNMIGQTIEGLSKVFLKLLLQLNRIARRKSFDVNDIKSKDLGVVIDELINSSNLKELLLIQPHNIRLNQWRNIAYHHNTRIVGKEIICSYKHKEEIIDFKITREELTESLKRIFLTFKLIRIAETIFCFDNLEAVQKQINKIDRLSINIREEAKLLDLYSSIGSQGFRIMDVVVEDNQSTMKLKDMQPYSDFAKRGIHSSQFLFTLWLFSNSKILVVEYFLPNGQKFLTSEINSGSFRNYWESDTFSELLKEVKFTPFIIDYQNKNPFDTIAIPKELKDYKCDFRSQRGVKISLKEFIRQFTLSVFSNYLVLRSEGFNENEISINIGSDGSMVIGDNENGKIVLHVPAIIREKVIQKYIIAVLEETIQNYKDYKLEFEIVEITLNNNQYYLKKSQIKEQLNLDKDHKQ